MIIYTDNYIIRNLTNCDTKSFYELAHDKLVKKYVPYSYCKDYNMAKENMSYYIKGDCKNDFYLAILKSDELIGSIIATKLDSSTLDVCTLVLSKWRGKGVMTEAMNGFIKWLKENTLYLNLNMVVEKSNIASIKQILKINGKLYNSDSKKNFYRILIR